MPTYRSDPALVDACLRGERAAWDTLVARYSRLVWSIPRKHGFSSADSEDVHQTTFASLVHHLGDLHDRERLSSWLITTATRECWRLHKLNARRANASPQDSADAAIPETDPNQEQRQLVREGLDRLNDRCRELLQVLFAVEGEPHYPTIAEQLDMPVGSIGPTRARCLAKLELILRGLGVAAG